MGGGATCQEAAGDEGKEKQPTNSGPLFFGESQVVVAMFHDIRNRHAAAAPISFASARHVCDAALKVKRIRPAMVLVETDIARFDRQLLPVGQDVRDTQFIGSTQLAKLNLGHILLALARAT